MALAGIDTLLIQASYSQRPAESRCLGTGEGDGGGLRRRFQSQRCDAVPPDCQLYSCRRCGRLVPYFPVCKMEIITVPPSQGLSQVRFPRSKA